MYRKPIIVLDVFSGETWSSIRKCSLDLGVSHVSVKNVVSGRCDGLKQVTTKGRFLVNKLEWDSKTISEKNNILFDFMKIFERRYNPTKIYSVKYQITFDSIKELYRFEKENSNLEEDINYPKFKNKNYCLNKKLKLMVENRNYKQLLKSLFDISCQNSQMDYISIKDLILFFKILKNVNKNYNNKLYLMFPLMRNLL